MNNILLDFFIKLLYQTKLTSSYVSNSRLCTIMTFHRILPENLRRKYPLPGLVITPEELYWIINSCQKYYTCSSLSSSIKLWEENNNKKKPSMAITFDDGQEDNYRYGLPVLKKLGASATFFIPVDNVKNNTHLWHDILGFSVMHLFEHEKKKLKFINEIFNIDLLSCNSPVEAARMAVINAKYITEEDRDTLINDLKKQIKNVVPDWSNVMNWEQLKELIAKGNEIGSHSMTHPILPRCSLQKMTTEITESKKVLDEELEIITQSFSFPNGDYDNSAVDIVKEAGYKYAVTTKSKANKLGDSLYELGRHEMVNEKLRKRCDKQLSEPWLMWRLSAFKRFSDQWRQTPSGPV